MKRRDHIIVQTILALALIVAHCAGVLGKTYDVETDIGLVAGKVSTLIAARNTERLSGALKAQWHGGKFQFRDGHRGPVLYPITCAAKEFQFIGTIETSDRIGGCLEGAGGRSYQMIPNHAGMGGFCTYFTRIDTSSGPLFRLRGTGFYLRGIMFNGRVWNGGENFVGPRAGVGIEVEGRQWPSTGSHTIVDCGVTECRQAVLASAGYWDAGKFIADWNHADQTTVERFCCGGCETVFLCDNPNAIGWSWRDIQVCSSASGGATCFWDIAAGGNHTASNVQLNHHDVTLLRLSGYSHNTQRETIDDVRWDSLGKRLTLLEYAGPVYPDMHDWLKFSVRITGSIADFDTPADPTKPDSLGYRYDAEQLLKIPAGLPRADLLFDISRVPLEKFEPAGGAWWRPKP